MSYLNLDSFWCRHWRQCPTPARAVLLRDRRAAHTSPTPCATACWPNASNSVAAGVTSRLETTGCYRLEVW